MQSLAHYYLSKPAYSFHRKSINLHATHHSRFFPQFIFPSTIICPKYLMKKPLKLHRIQQSIVPFFFSLFTFPEEVHSCLWQDCGFCSVACDAELLRHMLFHCYHTKLKQWGSAMLKADPKMGDCSVGLQNRNIVPEVQESFLCQWEHCEVRELCYSCSICFITTSKFFLTQSERYIKKQKQFR